MSYDITLNDTVSKETIEFESKHLISGGTYAVGGTSEAWLNITYNYADWYYMDGVFHEIGGDKLGIRTIYGMTGAESIPVLKNAIMELENSNKELSDEEIKEYEKQGAKGYWIPTKENAIRPLYGLLAFAKLRPDGVWNGD